MQQRVLGDGSKHDIYKRYFEAPKLVTEIGGGEILMAGTSFVAVEKPSSGDERYD